MEANTYKAFGPIPIWDEQEYCGIVASARRRAKEQHKEFLLSLFDSYIRI